MVNACDIKFTIMTIFSSVQFSGITTTIHLQSSFHPTKPKLYTHETLTPHTFFPQPLATTIPLPVSMHLILQESQMSGIIQ